MTWFWLWMVFVVFLFILPLMYGWTYKGWGPPHLRALRRFRHDPASQGGVLPDEGTHAGWGTSAYFLWLAASVAVLWLIIGLIYG